MFVTGATEAASNVTTEEVQQGQESSSTNINIQPFKETLSEFEMLAKMGELTVC